MINNILSGTSLQAFNTFGVQSKTDQYIEINSEEQLTKLYENGLFEKKFFVLGGGSNVLFTKDYDGLIIHIKLKGKQHFIEGNYAYVSAAGGEVWNDLVWYCIDHNFPGVENMALIPGTVGASPIQNIGAYGMELMNIFYTCRAFDTIEGKFVAFNNDECGFSYRDSIFKSKYRGRYIITSVTYKLYLHAQRNTSYGAIESELLRRDITQPSIKDIAEVVSHIRVEKLPDPQTIGNAGSFFKNPIIPKHQFDQLIKEFPTMVHFIVDDQHYKIAAGWLIEQCNWKGKQVGEVLIWPKQALVITNAGNATGIEIFNVSEQIITDVKQKFGILLEREVNIL